MNTSSLSPPNHPQIRILVITNPSFLSKDSAAALGQILPIFEAQGVQDVTLYFPQNLKDDKQFVSIFAGPTFQKLQFADNFSDVRIDWAFVFGGDGAVLWAHRALASQPHVVYFSFNVGHLGVITSFLLGDLPQVISFAAQAYLKKGTSEDICVKKYYRVMATVRNPAKKDYFRQISAINEVVVSRIGNYCPKYLLSWNGTRFLKMGADGLIISTAIGSTAYNSSVGGPTIMPGLPNFVVSAIAPFGVNFRPLVFGAHDVLTLELDPSSYVKESKVIGDSNNEFTTGDGDVLEIRLEPEPSLMLAGFVRNLEEEWAQRVAPIFKWEK